MRRPLLCVAAVLSLGIASQRAVSIPFPYAFAGAIISLALAMAASRRILISHAGLYLSVFFLGALCYQNSITLPAGHISNILSTGSKAVFLKGVITDDPVRSKTAYDTERLSFTLKADSVREGPEWRGSSGLVKVDLYAEDKNFGCGDCVILEGIVSKPRGLKNPGLFDYSGYLETKDIYAVFKVKKGFCAVKTASGRTDPVRAISYALRHRANEALERNFAQPHLGFLKAILIGERNELEDGLNDDFIKTGTVHILSISGQHVTMVAVMLLWIFAVLSIPKRAGYLLATASLVFYFFLAGSSAPVARSVIMFAVFSFGYVLYRESDILNALSVAAIIMLVASPKGLFDPSFQLSFLSILSIAVLAPRIDDILLRRRANPKNIRERAVYYILKSVSVSAAATVGIAPVVARYFNIVSPVAIAANLIVMPIVFAVMALAFLFLCLSLLAGAVAGFIAPALILVDRVLFAANRAMAVLPFSNFRVAAPSALSLTMYYAFLFIVFNPRARRHGLIAFLLFFAVAVWERNAAAAPSGLRVSFLDVGRGDCELVEFPDGSNMLIDTGPGGSDGKFNAGRNVIAPYLWNRGIGRIDLVVVSHLHEDHLGGAAYILDNFDVKCVIDANAPGTVRGAGPVGAYERLIKKKNIRHLTVVAGERINGFKDAEILVFNPPAAGYFKNENDNSIVMKLIYKDLAILFCGDITSVAMEKVFFYGDLLRADVLKVPHHGGSLGNYAVVKRFFEKISPRLSIVNSGAGSDEIFEVSRIADILTHLGSKSYSINRDGAAIVVSGGGKKGNKRKNQLFYILP